MYCIGSTPTRRAVGLRPTVLRSPRLMTLHKQGFHSFPILAELQHGIPYPLLDIDGSVQVSMGRELTDDTAKRLLVWPILSLDTVTDAALLRGVRTLDFRRRYSTFGRLPGDLFWDACQIGGTQIGVH